MQPSPIATAWMTNARRTDLDRYARWEYGSENADWIRAAAAGPRGPRPGRPRNPFRARVRAALEGLRAAPVARASAEDA